jgi:disulfide bond formation protein DsbB
MSKLLQPLIRHWLVLAVIASAGMLAVAHGFETFGHLPPCTLCLRQREVYWVALVLAVSGVVISHTVRLARFTRPIGALLALVFLVGAATAVYHAGAEWKWWPGPTTCASAGGGGVSAAALSNLLHGAKVSAPHCDEAAWRMLGLSMAGWNVLISLGLAALSALFAATPTEALSDD